MAEKSKIQNILDTDGRPNLSCSVMILAYAGWFTQNDWKLINSTDLVLPIGCLVFLQSFCNKLNAAQYIQGTNSGSVAPQIKMPTWEMIILHSSKSTAVVKAFLQWE